jgi:REP element-mobilizing transposase RayT
LGSLKEAKEQIPGSDPFGDKHPDRSAGVPPAVAGASRPRFGDITIRDRGRLPHWETDSVPHSVLEKIEFEKKDIFRTAANLHRDLSPDERKRLTRLSTTRIEQFLDSGAGACHLRIPEMAHIVSRALRHFDEKRYRLFAWCIMPNHVHVVARLFPGNSLSSVLHSWKSFTAKQAEKIIKVNGAFWQREYYDHLLRSEAEFERAVEYVLKNRIRAGLEGWPWVWERGRDAPATAGGTPALL